MVCLPQPRLERSLCNSVWLRGEFLGLRLGLYCFITLRVLCALRSLTLWFLRGDFLADALDCFLGVFPITESTEAKKSFTGGAKA